MNSCDISPLAYSVLTQSLETKDNGDSCHLYLNKDISRKIRAIDPSGLEWYLEQKWLEYIQMIIVCRVLSIITEEDITLKMSYFMKDLMSGIDAWLTLWGNRRIAVDVTWIGSLASKLNHYNEYIAKEEHRAITYWIKRGWCIRDNIWRVLIAIPTRITSFAKEIASQAKDIDNADTLISVSFHEQEKYLREIVIYWLNRSWERWVEWLKSSQGKAIN